MDTELVVTRVFAAPCERVWEGWTTPELIAQWFAPGVLMDVRELDVQPGGQFRFADPNEPGTGEYTGTYVSVEPLQELSFTVVDFSNDPAGVHAGFKIVFESVGDQTRITLTCMPPEPYDKATVDAWNGCFDRLANVIQ
jgi:uncharacterized protein YndB with AHSA1/START domain